MQLGFVKTLLMEFAEGYSQMFMLQGAKKKNCFRASYGLEIFHFFLKVGTVEQATFWFFADMTAMCMILVGKMQVSEI